MRNTRRSARCACNDAWFSGPGADTTQMQPPPVGAHPGAPRIARSLASLLVALLGLVVVIGIAVDRAGQTLGYIERQNQINAELPRLHVVLQDLLSAETGQRGYLLTGRSAYLEPYLAAVQELDAHVHALIQLHVHEPAVHARLLRAQTLVQLKLADLRETIRLQDRGRHASALELMLSDHGKTTMDELRAIIEEAIADQSGERDRLAARIAEEASLSRGLLIAGTSLLVLFVSLALRKLAIVLRDNALLVHRLESEATHDPLTGLPNRRYLGEWLAHNLAVAARGGPSVAVFFIDLDGFKRINDASGHEAGDKLLVDVAQALRQTLRQADFLCRLGGDEFAVVAVDGSGKDNLKFLGQRLIDAVVAVPPIDAATGHTIGASVGIAIHREHGASAAELLAAADHAMYEAKQAGKRRVRVAKVPNGH